VPWASIPGSPGFQGGPASSDFGGFCTGASGVLSTRSALTAWSLPSACHPDNLHQYTWLRDGEGGWGGSGKLGFGRPGLRPSGLGPGGSHHQGEKYFLWPIQLGLNNAPKWLWCASLEDSEPTEAQNSWLSSCTCVRFLPPYWVGTNVVLVDFQTAPGHND
jgi:hypothetical protein